MFEPARPLQRPSVMVPAPLAQAIALPRLCPLVVALACAGCSQGPIAASSGPPTLGASGRAHTLMWATSAEDAPPSTYALADDGTPLSRRDGIHIWASGTEWNSEVTEVPIPTRDCSEGPDQPAQEGRGVRVRLVPADPTRPALEIVSPAQGEEANEVDQSARLLASIGPYVFVEESTFTYTCGAHGNTGVSFAVWSLDEGRVVDVLSDLPDREHLLASGKQAIDAMPDAVDFSRPEDPPEITELLPRVGTHGRLETTALVTVPSCYACTAGGWSSYTVSTQVPVPIPWRLRGMGEAPRTVGLFADAHPDLTVGGYSVLP